MNTSLCAPQTSAARRFNLGSLGLEWLMASSKAHLTKVVNRTLLSLMKASKIREEIERA
jgi:hypothetical protein